MTKEVERITCKFCESEYKLIYNQAETAGVPKFCSFCGEECYDDSIDYEEEKDDDE